MIETKSPDQDVKKIVNTTEKALKFIGVVNVALVLIWVLIPDLGVDHLTTVTWMTPASLAIAFSIGTTNAFITLMYLRRAALRVRLDTQPPMWVTQPARQILGVGIVWATVSLTTGSLLGVTAQYLPGTVITVSAKVKTVVSWHRRSACRSEIIVLPENHHNTMTFCLLLQSGHQIGPADLEPNENVFLQLRQTTFGSVVEFVNRTPKLGPQ